MVTFVYSDQSNLEKYDKFPGLKLNVEELEMLLEAYFAQTNGILQRLFSVSISLINSCILVLNTNMKDSWVFTQ